MIVSEEAAVPVKRRLPLPAPWREVGVLLATAALLMLPWFRDPSPRASLPPSITGLEFLTKGAWAVMLGFGALWLAYAISRFTNVKWAAMIVLVIASLAYLWIHWSLVTPHRWDPAGLPLGRDNGPYGDVRFQALAGVWVNWAGLVALALGIYLAETGRGRTAVLFSGLGALLGFGLNALSALSELSLAQIYHELQPYMPAAARADSDAWYVTLMWLQILGLPIGGGIVGAWIGLKRKPDTTAGIEDSIG